MTPNFMESSLKEEFKFSLTRTKQWRRLRECPSQPLCESQIYELLKFDVAVDKRI